MNLAKLFTTILIVLDLFASVTYGINMDWRRAIYWFSAAVLTITVTY